MSLDGGLRATEGPDDFGTGAGSKARRWIAEIELAERTCEPWRARGRRIAERYAEADRKDGRGRRFALFWSNVETLKPATLARGPQAVVGRRFKDEDPVGRVASEVLERALNFALETGDLAEVLAQVRDDLLLVARGCAWVRYVPHMVTVTPAGVMQGEAAEIAEGGDPYEVVAWEEAACDHVSFDDFLHNPARKWAEVRWVARRAYLTREELIARFGEETGRSVPLDHAPDDASAMATPDQWKKAAVWEIWDKPSRKALWLSLAFPDRLLDERDDPLGLQDFFPCPRPALGTASPLSLVPTPDYVFYEGQCRDIDELTARIGKLADALKLKGFYAAGDAVGKDLKTLFGADNTTLIPVDSWAAFAERGGAQGLIEWVPLDMVVQALKGCIEARQQLIADVYQVTGISDIMRGDVDPDETATATAAKDSWGSSRVRGKQKELARFSRDLLRIMAQVIAGRFTPDALQAMTNIQLFADPAQKMAAQQQLVALQARAAVSGQPPPPVSPALQDRLASPTWAEVCALLQDHALRAFRIDIETDSTIEPHDGQEKQRRIEFVGAVGDYVGRSLPAIQLAPQLLPIIVEGLKFLVRGFRAGREMEEVIDRAMDQLIQAGGMAPPPGPKGPDPGAEQARAQAAVIDAQTRQLEAQTHRGQAIADAQNAAARIQAENLRTSADRAAELHMHGEGLRADLASDMIQAMNKAVIREGVREMAPAGPIGGRVP
jgi:hypothetical protein